MKNNRKNRSFSTIIKALNILAVIYGLTRITEGIVTFTKFTTLSNVGIAVVMLVFLLGELIEWRSGKKILTERMYDIKFIMTAAIMLTFLVFLCILAPTSKSGFIGAYLYHQCRSLSHHFISPILAAIDFYVNDREYIPSIKVALLSMLFPFIYVVYIMLLAATGYRWSHGMYAPYNFLNFGAPTGWWGWDLKPMTMAEN